MITFNLNSHLLCLLFFSCSVQVITRIIIILLFKRLIMIFLANLIVYSHSSPTLCSLCQRFVSFRSGAYRWLFGGVRVTREQKVSAWVKRRHGTWKALGEVTNLGSWELIQICQQSVLVRFLCLQGLPPLLRDLRIELRMRWTDAVMGSVRLVVLKNWSMLSISPQAACIPLMDFF